MQQTGITKGDLLGIKAAPEPDCSWFGFKVAIREQASFTRTELAKELDRNHIGNRMLFGGNLLRQPSFIELRRDNPGAFRAVGKMTGADQIMLNTLFMGTYPGLSEKMLQKEISIISKFIKSKKCSK